MVASPEVKCLISQTHILGLSELAEDFADVITGSLPGPRLTVAEASDPSLVWKIQEIRRELCSPVMIRCCCAWAFSECYV